MPDMPGALVFETGTNQWRRYPSWPPPQVQSKTLYLREGGKLSFDPPGEQERPFDEYISDPAHPVPYLEHAPTNLDESYMYGDQSFASRRADVLTFRTDPLQANLTVAGPVAVRLHVSSSGTDSDFVVKLIDEDDTEAAHVQRLVRGEPMRARFRNSFSEPEALVPDLPTPINYAMPDVNHTFLRGHRVVVQVQSSWFPLSDVNPQTYVNISHAKASEFRKATQRVFHKAVATSTIIVQVVP